MRSNTLKALLTIFVLGSGLISCSKDKKTVFQDDSLRTDKVSSRNSDSSVLSGKIPYFEAQGKLIFNELTNNDFTKNPVVFEVESVCRQNGGSQEFTSRFDFQNRKDIEVRKLLPEEILGSIDPLPTTCDFTVVSKWGNGSTNTNKLTGVEIKNLSIVANLPLDIDEKAHLSLADNRVVALDTQGRGTGRLTCTDFTKIITVASGALTLGQFGLDASDVQSQLKSSSQTCRIVFKQTADVKVSQIFTLDFPVAEPVIKAVVQPLPVESHFKDPTVLILSITNPNAFPITLTLQKKDADRFMIRPIYMNDAYPLLGRLQAAPIVWGAGDKRLKIEGKSFSVTVAPGETFNINGVAHREMMCPAYGAQSIQHPSAPSTFSYAGNNYDYAFNSILNLDVGIGEWEELEVPLTGLKPIESPQSDLRYWNWPSNYQIQYVYGRLVDVWTALAPYPDVCHDM